MDMKDMVNSITMTLKRYADFSGRSRRREFWLFTLFIFVGMVVFGFVDYLIASAIGFSALSLLFSLALIIPSLAVAIRRLHDIGKSGWWLLLNLIPFGGFVILYFNLQDSQPGTNQYGPNPKGM